MGILPLPRDFHSGTWEWPSAAAGGGRGNSRALSRRAGKVLSLLVTAIRTPGTEGAMIDTIFQKPRPWKFARL